MIVILPNVILLRPAKEPGIKKIGYKIFTISYPIIYAGYVLLLRLLLRNPADPKFLCFLTECFNKADRHQSHYD
jgi:hypothetical protein